MYLRALTDYFFHFSRFKRRSLLIAFDALLLPLSVWLCFWLRLAHPFHLHFLTSGRWLLITILIIGLPLYALTGQYQGLTRYVGSRSLYRLAVRNALLVLLLVATGVIFNLPMPPRSSWILLWLLTTAFTGSLRFAMRDLLLGLKANRLDDQLRVAIYGAGEAAAQLSAALRLAGNHQIVVFFDDDPTLWNRNINGTPIQPPHFLPGMINQLDQVLLAIPSLSRSRRRFLVEKLQLQGISVLQTPSVSDIVSGRFTIDSLRPVTIEDILGRDSVVPNSNLLGPGLRDAVICVTGAGGSIGSELCRQILRFLPRKLILLDSSETSLYLIEQELRKLLPENVLLLPLLGTAADFAFVERIFADHCVDKVFHAAAYKHVPLVEANPLSGLANNVRSTRSVCVAASVTGVSEMVLISSDKAVRPSNVMGASKRLAELVVQASAIEEVKVLNGHSRPRTCFSMVRFGNVLGSSGSVVPLFRKQIAAGGPITLTHPDMVRYFMTIQEAAQLVLQAANLADGGDLFLLDMGEPVKIKYLAEQMVRLSGLNLIDKSNPSGDIEIVCTGLRPGEKLYEELLIDAESLPTLHPLIYRAHERFVPPQQLWPQLDLLDAAIKRHDVEESLSVLSDLVPEWQRQD